MFISKKLLWCIGALLLLAAAFVAAWNLMPSLFGGQEVSRDAVLESFPVVIRTNGGMLEVATVRYRKRYNLKNIATVMGMRLPFCPEEAAVTVDPHITYRVRLARRWQAQYENGTLYVTAPSLEPALPVAFETGNIENSLDKCWIMPSMDTQHDLLKSLSGTLAKEAQAPSRLTFARDNGARDTVKEFVQKWLVTQKGYDLPPNTPIDVAFAGE